MKIYKQNRGSMWPDEFKKPFYWKILGRTEIFETRREAVVFLRELKQEIEAIQHLERRRSKP